MADQQYQWPCCGYWTLSSRGLYDVCQVCYWEDDDPNETFGQPAPEHPEGPNHVQLWQARETFVSFGAAEARWCGLVRSPHPQEIRSTD